VIATTGCPSGEVQTRLRLGQEKEALAYAAKLQDILGKENVFMELMEHGMASELERGVRNQLLDIAKKLNMPLVATNDLHYARHQDSKGHEELLCVQTRGVMSNKPEYTGEGTRFAFEGDEYYVKSRAEMEKYFSGLPEALNNTLLIAERCDITIEPDDSLRPTIAPPAGMTEAQYLRQEAFAGLANRLPQHVNNPEYIERLNTELGIIELKNYIGYFLVVSDFVRWGKFTANPPVPTGFGRGSAAGSLLGFCLDITDVDPIKYDLLFERFINPERDSPPDIDMDFNDTDRERVIEYVKQKYGLDKVAQIVTFGKIGAKAALKDSVRILEQPFSMGEELSKALPEPTAGHSISLAEVYDPSAERYGEAGEFRALVEKIGAQQVVEVSRAFEGRTRSTGVHAAALVVSTKPVVETVPMMQRQADGAMITQWDYPTCEGLGLLKVDFLGLRNLGIIANAIKNVEKTKGIKLSVQEIIQGDMDDKKTFEMLARGDSLGVFQLDGGGMRGLMKQLRPTDLNDISALLALYRPGPMGVNAHTDYALRKNGEQEVTPIHAELKEPLADILNETYGIIAYQEQIMRIAQKVANYSLAQADNLRRAMGKKKKSILDAEYVPFSEGMKANGYGAESIKALWDILIPFADYGFNKSHSVGYGVLSYLTAFLKANYPAEFMSALLTSVADDTDKTALYLEDCKNMGIKVLPPDVNNSYVDYAPLSDTRISFGFKAIRGVGEKVAEEIVEIRNDRKFESVKDFVNRVPKTLANKRILEALTLGGAFDVLKVSRKSMMEAIPDITAAITKANRKPTKAQQAKLDAAAAQATLFGEETPTEAPKPVVDFIIPDVGEYSKLEKLKLERHALGLYVSGHPLEGLDLTAANANKISDFLEEIIKPIDGWVPRDAKPMRISGIVTSLQKKRTKKGETFALGTIEDLTGSIPFVMFPKAFAEHGDFLQLDGVYQMQGFPRKREMDGINFTVDAIRPLEFSDSGKLSLRIKLTEKQWGSGREALITRLDRHRHDGDGSTNVIVSIKNENGDIWEETLDFNVKASPSLTQEIRELFGMLSIGRWRKA
jgi:DNA polymerase-3 subunit alpha